MRISRVARLSRSVAQLRSIDPPSPACQGARGNSFAFTQNYLLTILSLARIVAGMELDLNEISKTVALRTSKQVATRLKISQRRVQQLANSLKIDMRYGKRLFYENEIVLMRQRNRKAGPSGKRGKKA